MHNIGAGYTVYLKGTVYRTCMLLAFTSEVTFFSSLLTFTSNII